jgi:hypothetical protein
MTFAGVTAHYQDAVCAEFKGFGNKVRMNHPGAHHPDDPHVSGILDTAGPRKIGGRIRAPIAGKRQNLWFKSRVIMGQFLLQTRLLG